MAVNGNGASQTSPGAIPWWALSWPWAPLHGNFGWRPGEISLAPDTLNQPINPGWNFGTVNITNQNSKDPSTERRIVEKVSYGRQLGRIMDALTVLIEVSDKANLTAKQKKAFGDFAEIADKVAEAKREAQSRWLSESGMADLSGKLKELKTLDRKTFDRLTGILRPALKE